MGCSNPKNPDPIPEAKATMSQAFKPVARIEPTPMFRKRPEAGGRFVAFSGNGPGAEYEVFFHPEVLEEVNHRTRLASPNETIGLLAGRVCCDAEGQYVIVEASEGGRFDEIDATPGLVRISSSGNAAIRERLAASYPC